MSAIFTNIMSKFNKNGCLIKSLNLKLVALTKSEKKLERAKAKVKSQRRSVGRDKKDPTHFLYEMDMLPGVKVSRQLGNLLSGLEDNDIVNKMTRTLSSIDLASNTLADGLSGSGDLVDSMSKATDKLVDVLDSFKDISKSSKEADLVQNLKESVTQSSKAFSSTSSACDSFTDLLKMFKDNMTKYKRIIFLVSLILVITYTVKYYKSRSVEDLVMIGVFSLVAYMSFPKDLFVTGADYFLSLIGLCRAEPDGVVEQVEADSVKDLISALIFGLFCKNTKTGKKSVLESFDKFLSNAGRQTDTLMGYFDMSVKWLQYFVNSIAKAMGFSQYFNFISTGADAVDQWVNKSVSFANGIDLRSLEANFANYAILTRLITDGGVLLRDLPRGPQSGGALALINRTLRLLDKVRSSFDGASFLTSHIRTEPVGIFLHGPPGVGKSTMIEYLHSALCARTLPEEWMDDFVDHPSTYLFNRIPENKYWEGYNDMKWVTVFDDFQQARKTSVDGDDECLNVVRAINTFDYGLHMASIHLKASTNFNSKFVLATTNVAPKLLAVETLNCPDAFLRRWALSYIVEPKPEFSKKSEFGNFRVVDKKKLPLGPHGTPDLTTDALRFIPYNMKTEEKGKPISFNEVVDIAVDKYNEHTKQFLQRGNSITGTILDQVAFRDFETQYLGYKAKEALDRRQLPKYDIGPSHATNKSRFEEQDLEREIKEAEQALEFQHFEENQCDQEVISRTRFVEEMDNDEGVQMELLVLNNFQGRKAWNRNFHVDTRGAQTFYTNLINATLDLHNESAANRNSIISNMDSVVEYMKYLGWQVSRPLTFKRIFELLKMAGVQDQETFLRLVLVQGRFERVISDYFINNTVDLASSEWDTDISSIRAIQKSSLEKLKAWASDKWRSFKLFWVIGELDIISDPLFTVFKIALMSFLSTFVIALGLEAIVRLIAKVVSWFRPEASSLTYESVNMSGKTKQARQGKTQSAFKTLQDRSAVASNFAKEEMDLGLDQNTVDTISSVISGNVYEMFVEESENMKRLGFITFLRGTVFMCPLHFAMYILSLSEKTDMDMKKVVFRKCLPNGSVLREFSVTVREFLQGGVLHPSQQDMDLFVCKLPKYVLSHKDIVPKFLRAKSYVRERDWDCVLVSPWKDGLSRQVVRSNLIDTPVEVSSTGGDRLGYISYGFTYTAITGPGYCGSLLFLLNKNTSTGTICGFHTSGNTGIKTGVSNFISRDFLEAIFKAIGDTVETVQDHPEPLPAMVSEMDRDMYDFNFVKEDDLPCTMTYKMALPPSPPKFLKSKIVKSPLHSAWSEPLTAPAVLKPCFRDGVLVDPMIKARKKYGVPWIDIDGDWVKIVSGAYLDELMIGSRFKVQKRIYNFEEAILGLEDEPLFRSINRQASKGFPYTRNVTDWPKAGPEALFNEDGSLNYGSKGYKVMKQRVEDIVAAARRNRRLLHCYTDFLKDERRPLEKVDSVSTRMVSGVPFDLNIVDRMYFGAFILWFHKNRVFNGSAIGVNPYKDWNLIAMHLMEFGGHGEGYGAGDFSSYDGSLKTVIMWSIVDDINKWYNDGPNNARIREILWLEIVNSRHVLNDSVVEWFGGMPSGNTFTPLINTIYNNKLFRLTWAKINGTCTYAMIAAFSKAVRLIALGDDNLYSVREEYRDKFDEFAVSKAMSSFGMTYTSELKGESQVGLRKLTDVEFLKRSFRFDNTSLMWVAPLRLDVVLEIPYWTKGDASVFTTITESNVNETMKELSLHGKEVFDVWSPRIVRACETRMSFVPKFLSYESCKEAVLDSESYY